MSARFDLITPTNAAAPGRVDEASAPMIKLGRALAVLLSVAAFVAMLLGYLMSSTPRQRIPTDPGTPTTVTTIGEPR